MMVVMVMVLLFVHDTHSCIALRVRLVCESMLA